MSVIIGPWPGSNVLKLREYDDVRIEFAREIERQAAELELEQLEIAARVMSGYRCVAPLPNRPACDACDTSEDTSC